MVGYKRRSNWLGLVMVVCIAFSSLAQGREGDDADTSGCGATILVETTVPCSVRVDDQDLGSLQKYGAVKVEVLLGEHVVLARSPAGGVLFRETIAVDNGGQRLVSIKAPGHPLIDIGDGTVEDIRTGLVWPARDNGRDIGWEEARAYCDSLELAGHDDWRLPKLEELIPLYDPEAPLWPKVLAGIELTDKKACLLSSTMDHSSFSGPAVKALFFHNGSNTARLVHNSDNRALCVRDPS